MGRGTDKGYEVILATCSVKCPKNAEALAPVDGECLTLAVIANHKDIDYESVRVAPDGQKMYQVKIKCASCRGATKDRNGFLNGVFCAYNDHP